MKVFISHTFSDGDLKLAQSLQKILSDAGIDGYLAETRRKYDKLIRDKIIAEIKNSDHMIAILTENTFDSASVNQELGYALREGISPVIMLEKNAKQGVLTFGIDPEEFTKDTFLESCKKVLVHIKEKGSRKGIPENMSEQLEEIKSKLDNQQSQVPTDFSYRYPEDKWYNEIMKYCENALPEEVDPLPTEAKECYSKILMLRQEVDEISESYENRPSGTLTEILRTKRDELKNLRNKLREWWLGFSN